jgi:hypothetical protein
MSLGQSGEVDKRQSTEHTPPESLKHCHQLAQTFFGLVYTELRMRFAFASKYAPSSCSVVSGLALRFRKR